MNKVKFDGKKIILTYENGDVETWSRVSDEEIDTGSFFIRYKGEFYRRG